MRKQDKQDRTLAQLRQQYEIEKELATKLRLAKKEDRKQLYTAVYDELFRTIPHHPQITKRDNECQARKAVDVQMRLLTRFLRPATTFLEIGAGSGNLALEVARHVATVYAIDVSEELTKNVLSTKNFKFLISDGSSIPIPESTVDVAYSYQLIEHLHPDDAHEQLVNIAKAMAQHGMYICATTNRLSGPHDISKYFDDVATCFHIKEYTATELYELFARCGFSRIRFCIGIKGRYTFFPYALIKWIEKLLGNLPIALCRRISMIQPVRKIIEDIIIIGVK